MNEPFRTRDEELHYLRKRTRELEEKIEQLEYTITSRDEIDEFESITIMEHYNVPLARARILWLLSSGRPITRERLMEEYASDHDVELRNVDSQIKRIRQVATDIPIKSIYGYGYQMEPSGIRRIREIVNSARQQRNSKSEPTT